MAGSLEKRIGYTFSRRDLLDMALTHASTQKPECNNERLEFLGDRVLGLAVASMLFESFPQEKEGALAKRHTALVQQKALARVAVEIDLSTHLKLSPAEAKSGGQKKETILSDALEALIGAVYIDGGYDAAHKMVARFWSGSIGEQAAPPEDAKTKLQEWVQAQGLPLPEYKLRGKSGTDHAPLFDIEVSVKGVGAANATAASKRAAEKAAAAALLAQIGGKKK